MFAYTLLITAAHVSSAAVRIMPYDPVKDFEPLAIIATGPGIAISPTSSPYMTIVDLVKTAKASPGKLNFGSAVWATSRTLRAKPSARQLVSRWCMCRTRASHLP